METVNYSYKGSQYSSWQINNYIYLGLEDPVGRRKTHSGTKKIALWQGHTNRALSLSPVSITVNISFTNFTLQKRQPPKRQKGLVKHLLVK